MSAPLRLRLRVMKPKATSEFKYYLVATVLDHDMQRFDAPAVLEFENPLDGSWHPVEIKVEL